MSFGEGFGGNTDDESAIPAQGLRIRSTVRGGQSGVPKKLSLIHALYEFSVGFSGLRGVEV